MCNIYFCYRCFNLFASFALIARIRNRRWTGKKACRKNAVGKAKLALLLVVALFALVVVLRRRLAAGHAPQRRERSSERVALQIGISWL